MRHTGTRFALLLFRQEKCSSRKGNFLNTHGNFRLQWISAGAALLFTFCLFAGVSDVEASTNPRLKAPKSHLGPTADSPIFLAVHGQVGGAFEFDTNQLGGGCDLVFRPGAASNFLPVLYNWNAGLCMQIDYQKVSEDESILSGDFIIRKYLEDMRDPKNTASTFAGLGFGASRVVLPPGSSGAGNKYWSFLAEVGREWTVRETYLFVIKAQYRHYDYSGYNYSNWAFQVGVGIPLPW